MMEARIFPDITKTYLAPSLGTRGPTVYGVAEAGEGAKERLAALLLETLAAFVPAWAAFQQWGPLTLDTGPLGQPLLTLGRKPGPGLSFSEAGGLLWAAVTAQGQVGLDAAREEDFAQPYPYHRAFNLQEWDWARRRCQGRTASAAALLWAAKEAAVKALGMGFHTLDPLDLEVSPPVPEGEGIRLVVHTPEPLCAWARALTDGWLALALA